MNIKRKKLIWIVGKIFWTAFSLSNNIPSEVVGDSWKLILPVLIKEPINLQWTAILSLLEGSPKWPLQYFLSLPPLAHADGRAKAVAISRTCLSVKHRVSPAPQVPNGKGQRKEASGGEKGRRYKLSALLSGVSRKERAKWSRGFYKGRSNEQKSDRKLLGGKMRAPIAVLSPGCPWGAGVGDSLLTDPRLLLPPDPWFNQVNYRFRRPFF